MRIHVLNRNNQAIPSPGQSLHISRSSRFIAKCSPEPLDRIVQADVKIHERVRGPKPLAKFLAGNNLAGSLDQKGQELEGLVLQLNFQPMFAKLA